VYLGSSGTSDLGTTEQVRSFTHRSAFFHPPKCVLSPTEVRSFTHRSAFFHPPLWITLWSMVLILLNFFFRKISKSTL
jgi:hypothetical protein